MSKIVEFIDVSKSYTIGEQKILANSNVSFHVEDGEFCVILGPSGAGKSTILNLLGGMDKITSGIIKVDDIDISNYSDKKLTIYRRNTVGFVFQFYNLMPQLTVLENVEIARELSKSSLSPIDVLTQVGLDSRANNFPSQISGGEQQRVSIARAIAKNPRILLCDEPTGALDIDTGKSIISLLLDATTIHKKTVIVVTHNQSIAQVADRVIEIKNGSVDKMYINKDKKTVDEINW